MSRKKRKGQQQQQQQQKPTKRRKGRGVSGTVVFIALIGVLVAVAAAMSLWSGDRPGCPPGQVWSSAHNHCH
jgi:hypothetical protein